MLSLSEGTNHSPHSSGRSHSISKMPKALLIGRVTNLPSHLMKDLCELLRITKLNTNAYHPECDGMVERFNRTLKAIFKKHKAWFGNQWDCYLSHVLWTYQKYSS